jgi:hypothetical protein
MMQEITEKYRPERETKSFKRNTDSNREETSEVRLRQIIENDTIDAKYGFERVRDHTERTGFLLNMHSVIRLESVKRL